MSDETRVFKNLSDVSPELKSALLTEAKARDITISDLVTWLLAQEFGGEFPYSGEKSMGADLETDGLRIKIPLDLASHVWALSRKTGITEGSIIQSICARNFGIEYELRRRPGGRKRKAEASA